jgi:hypothetical protein
MLSSRPPLKANWHAAKDSEGHVYYWNSVTRKVQWHRPEIRSTGKMARPGVGKFAPSWQEEKEWLTKKHTHQEWLDLLARPKRQSKKHLYRISKMPGTGTYEDDSFGAIHQDIYLGKNLRANLHGRQDMQRFDLKYIVTRTDKDEHGKKGTGREAVANFEKTLQEAREVAAKHGVEWGPPPPPPRPETME